MRRTLALVILLTPSLAFAWPRLGRNSEPIFQDSGSNTLYFTATVTAASAVKVYDSNTDDREIVIQNTSSSYAVYIGSSSSVAAASGPRLKIPTNGTYTTHNNGTIWAIAESGGSAEILGSVEYADAIH
jgi:hypothetical protein